MGGVNGGVALAAASGLFTLANAPANAILFISGPGAVLTASLLDGTARERMIAALVSGIIATLVVILAAGLGPRLLNLFNIKMIRIFGAIALLLIALLIAGIKIPEKSPLVVMVAGIIAGVLWR